MVFIVRGTDVSFNTRFPTNRRRWTGKGKFTPGVWHDIVMHVRWSRDASQGLVELWFDGEEAFALLPVEMATLVDDNNAFLQIGFLRGQVGETIYLDEAREGTSRQDVMLPPLSPNPGMPMGGSGGMAAGGQGGSAGASGEGGHDGGGGGNDGKGEVDDGGDMPPGEAPGNDGSEGGAAGESPSDEDGDSGQRGNGCAWAPKGDGQASHAWVLLVLAALLKPRGRRARRILQRTPSPA